MTYSLRATAKMVNLDKMRLIRLYQSLPKEVVDHNVELALQAPHYQPIYSLNELASLMSCSKYKALIFVKQCGIDLHYMGKKRIILLSDLHLLNQTGDWTKTQSFTRNF